MADQESEGGHRRDDPHGKLLGGYLHGRQESGMHRIINIPDDENKDIVPEFNPFDRHPSGDCDGEPGWMKPPAMHLPACFDLGRQKNIFT
jgi:hypothetical protein